MEAPLDRHFLGAFLFRTRPEVMLRSHGAHASSLHPGQDLARLAQGSPQRPGSYLPRPHRTRSSAAWPFVPLSWREDCGLALLWKSGPATFSSDNDHGAGPVDGASFGRRHRPIICISRNPFAPPRAQRKAHWMKLFENCEEHELELARLSVEGARLGSGEKIAHEVLDRFFKGKGLYGEIAGGALFLIAEEDPSDSEMARALDYFHCSRAHIAHPAEYEGLLCSFARSSGEDFGYGAIISIDFAGGIVKAHSTAVAPTPVRILRIGGLRVDTAGRELGEVRPWQV